MKRLLRWWRTSECRKSGHDWSIPQPCGMFCTISQCLRDECDALNHDVQLTRANRHELKIRELLGEVTPRARA